MWVEEEVEYKVGDFAVLAQRTGAPCLLESRCSDITKGEKTLSFLKCILLKTSIQNLAYLVLLSFSAFALFRVH